MLFCRYICGRLCIKVGGIFSAVLNTRVLLQIHLRFYYSKKTEITNLVPSGPCDGIGGIWVIVIYLSQQHFSQQLAIYVETFGGLHIGHNSPLDNILREGGRMIFSGKEAG